MKRLGFLECFKDVTSGNKKFKTTEYLQEGLIPIIDQGKKFIGGYTDSGKDKFKGTLPCIVYGDHSREVKYIDFDFALGADGVKVLEVNNKLINPKFAYYYLITVKLPEAGYDRSFKFLKRIGVPVPDLQTQRQIVAALDKAQSIIDKRQKSIELLDELLRATFLDMFGDPFLNEKNWQSTIVDEVVERIQAGWSVSGENREKNENEFGVLKVSAVTSGRYKASEHKVVTPEKIKRKLVIPKKGDVLFSRANTIELVGATCIVDQEDSKIFLPDKLWKIHLTKSKVTPEYFVGVMQSKSYRMNLALRSTGSSGSMLNISQKKFLSYQFPLAKYNIQQEYSRLYSKINHIRAVQEEYLAKANTLFQSLLQRAFHGDLTLDMDLQLDAFIDNEDLQVIEKDDVLIQLLIDRFERHNLGKVDIEDSNGDSENGYQFDSLASYEKAKYALFHLLKKEKVVQQYNTENNKTSLSLP